MPRGVVSEPAPPLRPCLLSAWTEHQAELLRYLRHHLPADEQAEDLLHDLFLRVVRQGERFCAVRQPRAWLFEVARHLLIDHTRRRHSSQPLPEDLAAAPDDEPAPVDLLSGCLPRVLAELAAEDREAIQLCDLNGLTQTRYAELKGLSLPAAKSRIQRARQRLRARLLQACQVRLDEAGRVCAFVPRLPG